jgi:alpha-ketoglutarate-dependent taurine dioxygenase
MTVITAEKLSACVGAQVVGADVDRLLNDDALPAWVLETLERHGALVFRGVHIDDTTQVAFSKKLGRVEVFGKGVNPEIFRVTLDPEKNRAAPYLRGTFDWHIDGCTEDVPIMATILCAHAVAEKGGETEFASTYAAFEDLDDELKDRCLALRVVHTLEAAQRLTITEPTPEELATWRARPAKVHPLVWTHQTGRKSLVLGATASHIEGLEAEESRALLDGLLAHSTGPERIYRHLWEVGDMVIWDNRGVLHRACPYDDTSPRDMHRTTLHGDEPIQ